MLRPGRLRGACLDMMVTRLSATSSGNGRPWLVLGALSALLCFVATGALAQQPDQARGITTRLDGSVKGDFDGMSSAA